jgi:2,3-dihydroxy-p-cumate/2,3-dihydroxybenzoate 3,4-dioxygenase
MDSGLRYRKLGYVALNVSDLARSADFYREHVGLDQVGEPEGGAAFFRCSADHHNVVLCKSPSPGLKRIGWEMEDEAALERAVAHFADCGLGPEEVAAEECARLRQGRTVRIREPASGLCMEYYSAMTLLAAPYVPRHTKIARLGHIVIWSADYASTLRFATQTLNFKVSDHFGDRLTFMRCFPNPFHHTFALGNGTDNRLHHVNFMVTDIDDVGIALHRLKRSGVEIVYGPGRHPPSGSVFLYYLDPDGLSLEYSYGMEEFPEANPRKPRLFEPVPASLDYWASPKDERFGTGGVIEPPTQARPGIREKALAR